MSVKDIAREDYGLATTIDECPFHYFWVALLSNGMEIYQNEVDNRFEKANPWLRLKDFCINHNASICNMAVSNKYFDPARQIDLNSMADGYFYSKRARKLVSCTPFFGGASDHSQGVGYLVDGKLAIFWFNDDLSKVEKEVRNLDENEIQASINIITK